MTDLQCRLEGKFPALPGAEKIPRMYTQEKKWKYLFSESEKLK